MTTPRKCENWLVEFINWTKPRSEAPESYILWTGLFALSTAIKRNVYIPESLLGSWKCFPNLFVFLVGPPGLRKTTTLDYLDDIYKDVPNIKSTVAPQSATQEALMLLLHDWDKKAKQQGVALTILSKEFGNLYKASTTKLVEFLTASYDGNKVFDHLTKGGGLELVHNPSVNLLAATTPAWIAENMTPATLQGGFASRVIWVFESETRRHQLFYASHNMIYKEDLRLKLAQDLVTIESEVKGEVEISEEDREFIERWYRNFMITEAKKYDTRVQGYIQRKPRHALTVAILLHISRSNDLLITKQDFIEALGFLEKLERKMSTVFASVGKNVYKVDSTTIVDFLAANGPTKRGELFRRFDYIATTDKLIQIMTHLATVGAVRFNEENDTYQIKEGGS